MGNLKQTLLRYTQLVALLLVICTPTIITKLASAAPTYKSTNYGVDEVFMGAGGLNDASSDSYWARASLGDIAIGNAASGDFQLYGGFTTTTDPFLQFTVDSANINLGVLSETATSYTSATFTVRTYLASGYSVNTVSDPPKVSGDPGTHTLATNATPTAPTIGTEQFGINLVANTSPASVGSIPVQLPDATVSYGQVDDAYDNLNLYKYTKDDRVAFSTKSSGSTQFTITYIYNIGEITPAGDYVLNHSLVTTSTF